MNREDAVRFINEYVMTEGLRCSGSDVPLPSMPPGPEGVVLLSAIELYKQTRVAMAQAAEVAALLEVRTKQLADQEWAFEEMMTLWDE